jgi:hypothetical protein
MHNARLTDLEIGTAARFYFNLFESFNYGPLKIAVWAICLITLGYFLVRCHASDRDRGFKTTVAVVNSLQTLALVLLFLLVMFVGDSMLLNGRLQ